VLHTLWELLEWAGVAWLGIELDIRYVTTMGDLAAGLGGSTVGAFATARFSWSRPELGGALFAVGSAKSRTAGVREGAGA
jgi:hypothetical protein